MTTADTPAADPVGTVAARARRVGVVVGVDADPWDLITGNQHPEVGAWALSKGHADVVGWPRQTLHSLAVALGHRATRSSSEGRR